jgi:hypothetical protein
MSSIAWCDFGKLNPKNMGNAASFLSIRGIIRGGIANLQKNQHIIGMSRQFA